MNAMKGLRLDAVMAIAVGFGALYLYKKFGLDRPGALNPTSRNNFIYQATGEIGLKIADMYPSVAERAVAEMLKVETKTPGSGYLVPSNIYNASGVTDAAGQVLTPARSSSFDLYRLQYGDGLMGRWIK